MKHVIRVAAAAAALGLTATAAAESLIYAPYPYSQPSDFPWSIFVFDYFHLEDFEGSERKPGYAATSGGRILGPSDLTDSVDSDDNSLDGLGRGGSSWFSGGETDTFTFTFDAAVLGVLPTHVGIVWTDVGNPKPTGGTQGMSSILFEAFGPGSNPISGIGADLGDGEVDGATAEDRFFGAVDPGGIAFIRITAVDSLDWEVDHLQYGFANSIPEPEQWLLMGLGVGAVAWRLRRRAGNADPIRPGRPGS